MFNKQNLSTCKKIQHKDRVKHSFHNPLFDTTDNVKIKDHTEKETDKFKNKITERREKLCILLKTEEQQLKQEVLQQHFKEEELRKIQLFNKIEAEQIKENENIQLEITTKRMQQYLAQCPNIRSNFTKKTNADTKQCNLSQIEQKTIQKKSEQQTAQIWHEILMGKVKEFEQEKIASHRQKIHSHITMANDLKQQISMKLLQQEEEIKAKENERQQLKDLIENVKNEDFKLRQKKQEKRNKFKADLDKQIEITKQKLIEHEKEEKSFLINYKFLNEDLQKERNKLKMNSNALHNELLAYIQNSKDFRIQQAKRDAEREEAIRKIAKAAEEKRDQVKIQEEEIRKKELEEVLKVRAKQLQAKQEQKAREKEERALEDKLIENQCISEKSLKEEKIKSKRLDALRYVEELKAQSKYNENIRLRERNEIELMYKRDLEKQEKYQKMIENVLNSTQLNIHGHGIQADQLRKCVNINDLITNNA